MSKDDGSIKSTAADVAMPVPHESSVEVTNGTQVISGVEKPQDIDQGATALANLNSLSVSTDDNYIIYFDFEPSETKCDESGRIIYVLTLFSACIPWLC
jgi:hypothetical protein